jgi:hypothetical protein
VPFKSHFQQSREFYQNRRFVKFEAHDPTALKKWRIEEEKKKN